MASTSASAEPPSPSPASLERLPTALYSRVLQFLPAEQKLRHLSRLSHGCPPLTAPAFHHSHLHLTAPRLLSLPPRPRSRLPPAVCGVHSVHCTVFAAQMALSGRVDRALPDALLELLSPPTPLASSPFSALRRLFLRFQSGLGDGASFLSALFPFPAAFPGLESLTLWRDDDPGRGRPDPLSPDALSLSALSHLPSLQRLTLRLPLRACDWADFLPLPSLHSLVLVAAVGLEMPPSVLLALPSLLSPSVRSLRLPYLDHQLLRIGVRHPAAQVKSKDVACQVRRQAVGEGSPGLQSLWVTGGNCDHALLLAPAFPSLTALRVDAMWHQIDWAAVAPALQDLPSLQHLSVAVGGGADRALWADFLSAAGPRLLSLHLRELHAGLLYLDQWLALVFGHCRRLRSLELATPQRLQAEEDQRWWKRRLLSSCDLSASLASLALLRSLTLWQLPLDTQQVELLLLVSPLLEDCRVKASTVSVRVLALLGRRCPLLRRLWLEGVGPQLLDEDAATALLNAAPYSGWFRHLRVLFVDWCDSYCQAIKGLHFPHRSSVGPLHPPSPRLLPLFPVVLASAPLRFLHLPLPYEEAGQLLLWSAFPHLRGLSLPGPSSPSFYDCTRQHGRGRLEAEADRVAEEEEEWYEKPSDEAMEWDERTVEVWERVFDESVDRRGRDGRERYWLSVRRREAELERMASTDDTAHEEWAQWRG